MSYKREFSLELKKWVMDNRERLWDMWDEELSNIRCSDSVKHYSYMAGSDVCFYEFCEEIYDFEKK